MNSDTVKYLADLARLDVPESERESVGKDMVNILGFIDEIQKVQIDSSSDAVGEINVFRDDVIAPISTEHNLIEAAAMHQDHFVKVPKVL